MGIIHVQFDFNWVKCCPVAVVNSLFVAIFRSFFSSTFFGQIEESRSLLVCIGGHYGNMDIQKNILENTCLYLRKINVIDAIFGKYLFCVYFIFV